MDETFSFGEWIAGRRKIVDITQRELAERASCTVATIKKIEGDERRPSRELAGLLANALHIPAEWRDIFIECARGTRAVDALSNMDGDRPENTHLTRTTVSVNIPAQSTPFLGREKELAQIKTDLSEPDCRLLTLIGPGGIGKTRLAYQAAAEKAPNFPAGVQAVPLAGVNAPDYLLAAIAERLKLAFYAGDDHKTQLFNYLREKKMLLVLDNFEHLLDGAGLVWELLAAAPNVKILVTSRERLNLQGEWLFPVEGFAFPENPLDDVTAYEAIRLFENSARRALPGYTLADDLPSIVEICKLVEGMPLAIELAASWMRRMPPEQIAAQIERDLDFLAAAWRDAPERHRSIRALFENSWRLLSADEQGVFMCLSVFRGGFDPEAAQQVAGASLATLASLEDKSLIRSSATGRYDLHELIRQYGESKLTEAGFLDETRTRHLDYCTSWAENSLVKLQGPEQLAWTRRIETEYDNLRAALAGAFNGGDAEAGLRLANGLAFYWGTHGHFSECREWLETGLAQTDGITHPRALAFGNLSVMTGQMRDHISREYLIQCRRYAEDLGMRNEVAMSYISETFAVQDYEAAIAIFEKCIAMLRETGARHFLIMALFLYGDRAQGQGDLEHAEALYKESLEIARAEQNPWGMASPLGNLGRLAIYRGDYERGKHLLEEAVTIGREVDNAAGVANYLVYLGSLAVYQGDYESAERDLNEVFATWQDRGHEMNTAHAQQLLADLALHREDFGQAARLLTDTLNITLKLPQWELNFSNREFNVDRLIIVGKLACAIGDYVQAAQLLSAGERLRASVGYILAPLPRAEFETAVQQARAQMGEAAFTAAWQAGQALSEEAALLQAAEYLQDKLATG